MKDGGPAFPCIIDALNPDIPIHYTGFGMSLRDYFAAKAMQGMTHEYDMKVEGYENVIAVMSYRIADAMIEARENAEG